MGATAEMALEWLPPGYLSMEDVRKDPEFTWQRIYSSPQHCVRLAHQVRWIFHLHLQAILMRNLTMKSKINTYKVLERRIISHKESLNVPKERI